MFHKQSRFSLTEMLAFLEGRTVQADDSTSHSDMPSLWRLNSNRKASSPEIRQLPIATAEWGGVPVACEVVNRTSIWGNVFLPGGGMAGRTP